MAAVFLMEDIHSYVGQDITESRTEFFEQIFRKLAIFIVNFKQL